MLQRILFSFRSVSKWEWLVLVLMIMVGIASRFYLADQWNIKPVAAFILFGGFFFRHWLIAVFALLAIMSLSDFRIGAYDWQLMLSVYVSLGMASLMGIAIRRRYGLELKGWSWIPGFAGASLAMSTMFYLLTNGSVWWLSTWYPHTLKGLLDCYLAGLPFFGRTLLGDFCFTAATVGIYIMVKQYLLAPQSVTIAQQTG